MKRPDLESIAKRMDALGLWKTLEPYNFAVKPRGTVFPYFCTILRGDGNPVKVRFLMLEGWQTLHDFVRTRMDANFGFYSSPVEFPHFELVVLSDGSVKIVRYDPAFMPYEIAEQQTDLVSKILWEAYGIFLRTENDPKLPLQFAGERAIFARVEGERNTWSDQPLSIPDPPPHRETVSLPKDLIKAVKDLPLVPDFALELDFGILPNVMTKESRPRCVYALRAVEASTGTSLIDCRVSATPEGGLRSLWETMPAQVLREFVRLQRVPGQVRVRSGRVFRLLRPICLELPIKLSLHDRLGFLI